jgi:serine/threonine-protein kinase HipA
MSVGRNRHYVVGRIMPRHFFQTAAAGGMPLSDIESVFVEILEVAPKAISAALAKLPAGFPEKLSASIIKGFEARLEIAGRWADAATPT